MNVSAFVLGTVVAASTAYAQSAACALSGQAAEGPFDPRTIEFVSAPKTAGDGPGFSVQMFARVVGVSPLVVEVLDTDRPDRAGWRTCERRRIYSVDDRLKDRVAQLRFNEVVRATLSLMSGGTQPLILTGIDAIAGRPPYFHENAQDGVCANRSGTLVSWRNEAGEIRAVYNDGSIFHQDPRGNRFDRQRLGEEGRADLLKSFAAAGFDALPGAVPPLDKTQGQASITLICARHQRVPVHGNETRLAPVIHALDQVKAKALAGTYYFLSYDEKRAITFVPWPFPQLPLERAGSSIRGALDEEFAARCSGRPIKDDFRMFHQDLAPQLFAKFPAQYSKHPDKDPNRDVYVRGGSRVFRVGFTGCETEDHDCTNSYRLSQLSVDEVLPPDKLLTHAPGDAAPGRGCPTAAPVCHLFAGNVGCSSLSGIGSVLWPSDAGVALSAVPSGGLAISNEDYTKHEALYRELLAAGSCGTGIDFVEGGYRYRNVRMSRGIGALPQ